MITVQGKYIMINDMEMLEELSGAKRPQIPIIEVSEEVTSG